MKTLTLAVLITVATLAVGVAISPKKKPAVPYCDTYNLIYMPKDDHFSRNYVMWLNICDPAGYMNDPFNADIYRAMIDEIEGHPAYARHGVDLLPYKPLHYPNWKPVVLPPPNPNAHMR